MKCKICNKEFKGKIGLNTHLRTHGIKPLDYFKKYDELTIPKCICGKNRKQKRNEIKFFSSCGDEICIKNIQREKRLKFMKENPDQTAWRKKNLSYPEKLFISLLENNNLIKQFSIERERPVFPYFIDFAFENVMVAVEIDGSQHELPDRKESDCRKDETLKKNGWRIFRVTAREVLYEGNVVISRLKKFIGSDEIFQNCGIKMYKTVKQLENEKLKKLKLIELEQNNGLSIKKKENCLSQRRIERPPYEQLKQEIKEFGYVGTGKKYGVSDNGVRRWVKTYEKYNF